MIMKNQELNLTMLRFAPKLNNQTKLSNELEISVGKVNYILKALIDKGFMKIENFATHKNKKQYKYLLTAKGIDEKITLTKKFIKRKKDEYEQLQRELGE